MFKLRLRIRADAVRMRLRLAQDRIRFLMRLLHDFGRVLFRVCNRVLRFGENAGRSADILRNDDFEVFKEVQQAVNLDHALVRAAKLGTRAFLQLLFDAVYNAENLHCLCAAHGFFNLSAMIF
ncbi:hypothetical protein SDC9_154921 [bioreactor metagenome]|uniref:Uncharacterized protein n=1 Tax=bioreactor metagenome TaxID=1076179 RepID=A0A645F1L3_9ZZZZ